MFTDRQSLILTGIIGLGFSFSGMLGILDNYAISGVLIVGFILVIVNLFMNAGEEDNLDTKEKNDSE